MNRKGIKEKAKEIVKNNIWNFWKPYLILGVIELALSVIFVYVFKVDSESFAGKIIDLAVSIMMMPMSIGCIVYVLKLVRGKKFDIKDVFSKMDKILPIWAISAITGLVCSLGFCMLIVPGFILLLMFSMTNYLIADGEEDVIGTIKKSCNIMNGHKVDYLVFNLSFVGWVLLSILTFGILLIWVIPYISISTALYYEKIK